MLDEKSLFPYIELFALVYAVALIAVALLFTWLDWESGTNGSIGALLASIYYAVSAFVEDHQSAPSKSEKMWLTWATLIASYVVSLILVIAYLALVGELAAITTIITQAGLGFMLLVFLIVSAIHYLVIWFAYGWFAKTQVKALEKSGKLKPLK